ERSEQGHVVRGQALTRLVDVAPPLLVGAAAERRRLQLQGLEAQPAVGRGVVGRQRAHHRPRAVLAVAPHALPRRSAAVRHVPSLSRREATPCGMLCGTGEVVGEVGAGMGMDVLAIFKDSPNARSYAAGDVIFNAGDVGHEMYVLLDGAVDIVLDGKRIEELGPGSVFGEMAIVDSVPRSADAVARTDVVVEPIDEEWFKHLIRRSPT